MSFYQSSILTEQNSKSLPSIKREDLTEILNNESMENKKEPWSKLNKTDKICKLNAFAQAIADKNCLNRADTITLKRTLVIGLEKKRLVSVKDVLYDKESGMITSIPSLTNDGTKYTLKRNDKRPSTLKSLTRNKDKIDNKDN